MFILCKIFNCFCSCSFSVFTCLFKISLKREQSNFSCSTKDSCGSFSWLARSLYLSDFQDLRHIPYPLFFRDQIHFFLLQCFNQQSPVCLFPDPKVCFHLIRDTDDRILNQIWSDIFWNPEIRLSTNMRNFIEKLSSVQNIQNIALVSFNIT